MLQWTKCSDIALKDQFLSSSPLYVVGKREFRRWTGSNFEQLPLKQLLAAEQQQDLSILGYCPDKTIVSYDASTGKWTRVVSTLPGPGALQGPLLSAFNTAIVVFGGQHKMRANNHTWLYQKSKWKKIRCKVKPPKRWGPRWLTINGDSLLMWGGRNNNWDRLTDAWLFDGERWIQKTDEFTNCDAIVGYSASSLLAIRSDPDNVMRWYLLRWDGDYWTEVSSIPSPTESRSGWQQEDLGFESKSQTLFYRNHKGIWTLSLQSLVRSPSLLEWPNQEQSPPEITNRVSLEFDDGETLKFWTGEADNCTLSLSWGRVGSKGQSKSLTVPSGAREELQRRARTKREKGYETAQQRCLAPALLFSPSRTVTSDLLGGSSVRGLDAWPDCVECNAPMILHAQIEANPSFLPLPGFWGIALFFCENTGSCESWVPHSGCNHVAFLSDTDTLVCSPTGQGHPISHLRKTPTTETEGASNVSSGTKLGGILYQLQNTVDVPRCSHCSDTLEYKLQLEASLGDEGIAHVYFCPKHYQSAAVRWEGY